MKQVISGTLANTPQLRTYPDKQTGEERQVCHFTIFVFDPAAPEITREDGSTYRKRIPLSCTAWGELAEEVCCMGRGDQLTASTTMRYRQRVLEDGTHLPEPLYVIRRIDPDNQIQKQMSSLLTGYEKGVYDRLYEDSQPELQSREGPGAELERFQKDAVQQSQNGPVQEGPGRAEP